MQTLTTNINPEKLSKDSDEFKRYLGSIYCLEQYSNWKSWDVEKIKKDFESLDSKYLSKLTHFNYKTRLERLTECISINQNFLDSLVKLYKPEKKYYEGIDEGEIVKASYEEYSYLETFIFKYIMRDWSSEKVKERQDNYELILNDVKKYFPPGEGKKYKFLIPGAGLCRLGYEIAKFGYDVDTNDYCFFNVIFCDYIFNRCKKNQETICPLLKSFCNWMKENAPYKQFKFPEEDVGENLKDKGKMRMFGGDFVSFFKDSTGEYDCIITCFFIDTAQNVMKYFEVILNALKKGGIWINFGPLSYHWSGVSGEISIELPYDELREVVKNYGFEILNEKEKSVFFCEMDDNMKNDLYKCAFFTAQKK